MEGAVDPEVHVDEPLSLVLVEQVLAPGIGRDHDGTVHEPGIGEAPLWRGHPDAAPDPAKDARMSPHSFRTFFPDWERFARHVDPKFSSSFWRRVAG